MPADSPQGGGRRTAEGAAAVAMLREKLDALDADLVAASAAVAVDPTDPAALQRRADLYLARGRKQEALADLRSAVALDQSAAPTDGVVGEWRRASWWLAWRVYTALVVVLGATVLVSALLAALTGLRGLAPSPLYSASERGDLAKVISMLRSGAPPDSAAVLGLPLGSQLLWQTPLSVAAARDHLGVVEALLDSGAPPDAGKAEGPLGWISTETPLYSVRHGSTHYNRCNLDVAGGPRELS